MGKWMIGCDGCDEWYHGECIRISKTDEALIDRYYCPRCQRNEVGHTTWKKKCRMVGCRKPVEQQQEAEEGVSKGSHQSGKYCSHAHGLAYFQMRLGQALLTKPQVASLVKCSATRADFCRLGDRAPAVEGVAFTAKEQQRLSESQQERQRIDGALSRLTRRQQLVTMMREKATRVNVELKARKEKEQCGLDVRLLMQEEALDALIEDKSADLEEQLRGTTVDDMCTVPVKKCIKHAGWFQIHSDAISLQEQLLKDRLDVLRGEDESIRKSAQRRI
ncbi:hypothetical protein BCR37DRAFT_31745 [Protomyces lactucae-debilis]|uniref:Zinc finger PHD-type domain-containing protein n=1 Tax=Protomyces lactucae-debilis TaxID=2754530 RepID=A0A1Y2FDP5_PROLT|nr:uncharacterized protein BCR37DRAFT_31745 [Protomyces lactucae-debilis]ORY82048.1 hypothetical protein BCR37DRAFT_31745 [Protomyces lactucae-debilis]